MTRELVVLGCALLIGGAALAKGKGDNPDPMAATMKYATPGPEHKALHSLVGSWVVAGKFWIDPQKQPVASSGSAEVRPLGDLWVVLDFKGEFMGTPYLGHGTKGFDLTKNRYVGTWIDTMQSYVMSSEGTADATGKVITYTVNDLDPTTGKMGTVREVTKIESDSRHTVATYKKGPDGKDLKIMELVYTRK
jgi:hypothetical protein